MKKVAILGLHLGYGGVEQSIVNLANMLCEKYEVELVITYQVVEEVPYKINQKVKITYLTDLKPNREEFKKELKERHLIQAFKEGLKSILILHKRISVMKKYIKNSDADILISSRVLYTKLVSKYAKKGVITIAQEHCHHNNNQKYINKVKRACRNINYLIPVSKELTSDYQKMIQNGKTVCLFIPNSLEFWPEKTSNLDCKNLISVGRISKEKGYLDLIDVFELIHQVNPDWKLNIIGNGGEMSKLKEKITEKKLEKYVILHGFQNKAYIYEQLLQSSIYVMCSYEESFGIVLLEAASFGIPLIAYSSAQGAHEIIENNENGYLIENRDKNKMATKVNELIDSQEQRIKLGTFARTSVEQFAFENVKEQWLKFLDSMEE